MKIFRIRSVINILIILSIIGVGYYYKDTLGRLYRELSAQFLPCGKPITYSIANIDPRFGLSKTKLLENLAQAEKIWESPIEKQVFEYSVTGDLKINLIYDYRQSATDAMAKIGITIKDDRSSYEELKAKYDSLVSLYNKQRTEIDTLIATFNTDKSAYEKNVNYWNGRGGAPKAEYGLLEQKRIELNDQVLKINQAEYSLNNLVDTINSAEIVLNQLVSVLNLQVATYNKVGASTGKQFSEGEYTRDKNGTAINIYQFNSTEQLVKILVHELGHALGLPHLNNPKAIMYYLNEGMNTKLTADDLTALKNVCGIK